MQLKLTTKDNALLLSIYTHSLGVFIFTNLVHAKEMLLPWFQIYKI